MSEFFRARVFVRVRASERAIDRSTILRLSLSHVHSHGWSLGSVGSVRAFGCLARETWGKGNTSEAHLQRTCFKGSLHLPPVVQSRAARRPAPGCRGRAQRCHLFRNSFLFLSSRAVDTPICIRRGRALLLSDEHRRGAAAAERHPPGRSAPAPSPSVGVRHCVGAVVSFHL